jgi:hypothetical protein
MHNVQALNRRLSELYDSQLKCTLDGVSPAVWSEGGEWLAISGAVYKERVLTRELGTDFIPVTNIGHALTEIERTDVSYFAMRCGTGKSTILAARIHGLKMSAITFVVVPSVITAKLLATYVTQTIRKAELLEVFDCVGGFFYVSAAQVLVWIISGNDLSGVTFIVDEAHCVTPVYRALKHWLRSIDNKVIMMTASVGVAVTTANTDCPVVSVECVTQVVKEQYAEHFEQNTALVVGVEDGNEAASPANLFLGNTFEVTLVMDTGLRLDPVYQHGKVLFGERVAQQTEVVQMTGRVGRGNARGVAVVASAVRASPCTEVRLYDVIYDMYLALMGFENHTSFMSALHVLSKLTGYEARETMETEVVVSTVDTVALHSGQGIRKLSISDAMSRGLVVKSGDVLKFTTEVLNSDLDITFVELESARLVLAQNMVPSFSVTEYHAVLHLFKRLAVSSRSRLPERLVAQFCWYSQSFCKYHQVSETALEFDYMLE